MMSIKTQIQNFNQKIINENVEITIIDYVKLLNYEVYHIDISFIDDFINLVKYGVISLNSGTYDVKIIIEQQKLESDTCEVRICPELTKSHQTKNVYYLHPRLFKLILIRSRNTHAKYYIFLEESTKHYSDFQVFKLQDKLNKKSTISILNLIDKDTLDRFVMAKK